ncbi:MAG: hypothetical protein JSV88_27045 [Candidatus Aminicenantes bacterium]|nr:MAG: hypothetical protein JSV88_27045 [Candidatus Aminicenantes bacterium]
MKKDENMLDWRKFLRVKRCVDCHFLILWDRQRIDDRTEEFTIVLDSEDRVHIRESNFDDVARDGFIFVCYRGQWHEGYKSGSGIQARQKRINRTSRNNCYYFLEYKPEVDLPAAKELQIKEYQSKIFRKQDRKVLWSLIIAFLSLIISFVSLLISINKTN